MAQANRLKIKNAIYNAIAGLTSHVYRDDNWAGVSNLCKRIRQTLAGFDGENLELTVSVPDGGYRTSRDGMAHYKVYNLDIEREGETIISGSLTAHAAGSVADPFDRYDMTVVLWYEYPNKKAV